MLRVDTIADGYGGPFPVEVDLKPAVLVLNGVSGTGKTSVCDRLRSADPALGVVRNFTTRALRSEAHDEIYYLAGDLASFAQHQAAGNVLGYLRWPANQQIYALLKSELMRFGQHSTAIYTCTHFGGLLKAQRPTQVCNVWLTCARRDVLRERLWQRNSEHPHELERRCSIALGEQQFILDAQADLVRRGLIDYVIETSAMPLAQVVDEVLSIMGRARQAAGRRFAH